MALVLPSETVGAIVVGEFEVVIGIREAGIVTRRVPLVRQMEEADCGAACLAMALGYLGRRRAARRAAGHDRDRP